MIRDYPDAPLSRPLFYLCRQLIQAQRYEKYLTYANKNEKKYTRRIKSRQMNEGYPLNSKKRIITEGTSPCYTRIEPEAGGAADRRRIHAPCIEAAYLTDARGESSARKGRTTKRDK